MQISPFEINSPLNEPNDSFNIQQISPEEIERRKEELKALSFACYYFNPKKEFEYHIGESSIIAKDILKRVVKKGTDIIVNKFIQSQMGTHSASRSLQLIHKSFQCDYQKEDVNNKVQIQQLIEEDTEPQDKNKPKKHEPSAPPIDLSEPAFIDKQEEYIRAEKEKQVKQQQEQAMQDLSDSKRKQITYDYDGQIIFINEVKGDKLPPPSHSMSYQITDLQKIQENKKQQQSRQKPTSQQQQQKPDKKANLPNSKKQQLVYRGLPEHKLPKESQQGIKAGQCLEEFELQKGVTLKFDGKVSSNILPIEQQFKSINLNDQNLKLTKQQYLSLTAEGNLNRKAQQSQTEKRIQFSPDDNENLEPQETKIMELSPVFEQKKSKQQSNRHQFRVKQKQQGIKILAKTAYNTMRLTVDESEEQQYQQQFRQEKQSATDRLPQNKFNSPIDEFNHHLITSKDWGKTSQRINTNQSLPPLKANFNQKRIILPRFENSKMKKRKRERFTKEEMQKGIRLEHMPAPRVGQIVAEEELEG